MCACLQVVAMHYRVNINLVSCDPRGEHVPLVTTYSGGEADESRATFWFLLLQEPRLQGGTHVSIGHYQVVLPSEALDLVLHLPSDIGKMYLLGEPMTCGLNTAESGTQLSFELLSCCDVECGLRASLGCL